MAKPGGRKEIEYHGGSRTSLYKIWAAMIQRCHNPLASMYSLYGAIGVSVCDRWKVSFAAFRKDIGPRPDGYSLDRYPDQSGNYAPGNVRWADDSQQQRNRRDNQMMTFDGKCLSIYEWATVTGITFTALRSRYRQGWPVDRILTEPMENHTGTRNELVTLGDKTQTVKEWSRELKINYYTLASRVQRGWPPEKALRSANFTKWNS